MIHQHEDTVVRAKQGFEALMKGEQGVRSLQEYHADVTTTRTS